MGAHIDAAPFPAYHIHQPHLHGGQSAVPCHEVKASWWCMISGWSRGDTTSVMALARVRGRSWGLRWPSILVRSPWGSTSSSRTFFRPSQDQPPDYRQWCFCLRRSFGSPRLLPLVSPLWGFLPSIDLAAFGVTGGYVIGMKKALLGNLPSVAIRGHFSMVLFPAL